MNRIIRDPAGIELHPNSMNKEEDLRLSRQWQWQWQPVATGSVPALGLTARAACDQVLLYSFPLLYIFLIFFLVYLTFLVIFTLLLLLSFI
jgi:hypothetical protein